jgi:hypothetical protein
MSGTTPPNPPLSNEAIWAKPLIGGLTLGLFVLMLGAALYTKSDQSVLLLTGAVVSMTSTVVGFYFGSSAGSERKSDLLAQPPKP